MLARLDSLTNEEALKLLAIARAEIIERAKRDGLFWLQYVKTRDEADPDATVKPFPVHKQYVREVWQALSTEQKVIIAKSRQMMISWIAAAFCVWTAWSRPNQYVVFQTQKEDDALSMVCLAGGEKEIGYSARMQFILLNLPEWLRPKCRYLSGKIDFENGSLIEAAPGGADQVRGKVFSLYVGDEMAFQPEAKGVWTTIAPLVQKGSKVVLVSTPNGADGNLFYHLFTGLSMV